MKSALDLSRALFVFLGGVFCTGGIDTAGAKIWVRKYTGVESFEKKEYT